MVFGTLCSILLGSGTPLMMVVFGHMTDLFIDLNVWPKWAHGMYDQYNISQYTNITADQFIDNPDVIS